MQVSTCMTEAQLIGRDNIDGAELQSLILHGVQAIWLTRKCKPELKENFNTGVCSPDSIFILEQTQIK